MVSNGKKNVAMTVAEYFLYRAQKEGKSVTNKKLQKLVYYAQAWSLALNKKQLFREPIEAWIHGPAIPSVYRHYKKYEFGPILESVKDQPSSFSKKDLNVLDSVWRVYGGKPADYLEALTHSELPWQEARENLPVSRPSNNKISISTMQKYYAGLLRKPKS